MNFIEKLKSRDAEGVTHKPVNNSGMPANGTRRTNMSIGDIFETTYSQEPRYEEGTETLVKNEKRKITDRDTAKKQLKTCCKTTSHLKTT